MMRKKPSLKLVTGGILLGALLCSHKAEAIQVGRYSGEFMSDGAGARALSMGNASTTFSADVWSLYYNPAGLVGVNGPEAGLMHSERFAGVVQYDAVVYAVPERGERILAAGVLRSGVNGIPFTRLEHPGQPLGVNNRVVVDKIVSDGEYAFYLARAATVRAPIPLLGELSLNWGLAPKLIFKHIGSYRAYGLGLDAGVAYRSAGDDWFGAGASLRDACGTVLAWEQTGQKEVIVPTIRFGFGVGYSLVKLQANASVTIDGIYRFESLGDNGAFAVNAGGEYVIAKMVALRVGSEDGRLTYGGGLQISRFRVDYAFIGHRDLGDSHRVSINFQWGGN